MQSGPASPRGGVVLRFTDGSYTNWITTDGNGEVMNSLSVQNAWVARVVDLSPFAGKTQDLSWINEDGQSGPGDWEERFADIALIHADGSVLPIFNGQKNYTSPSCCFGDPGVTNQSIEIEETPDSNPLSTTRYYLADQVGTTQFELAGGGWPLWQGFFTPFGQEIVEGSTQNALGQVTPDGSQNPFKFTGKERDTESGLDYFGARYYGSDMGRWMSPDWADRPEAVPYSSLDNPQSLNLYGYVLNNPLSKADPDGHAGCPPDCSTGNNFVDFFLGVGNAFSSDNLLGAGRVNQTSAGGQLGARLGDATALVTGAIEVGLGALGEIGGLALDATGVGAFIGVPANVVSAGAIAHGATTNTVAGANLMFSKRTGDFTKGEKNAMDSKNAADNGGVNRCTNCGQEVQKVQNKAGEPTPGNQLQRHHDPPLSQRPAGTNSPNDRILCKDCHVQEHHN